MPRANRYFIPGHVWHITHRCHNREFLLKFARDRKRWCYWLYEARKRYGLCVLNYMVTSNHIHLLVLDTGSGVIPKSMQLIAGRTAQEYNSRKRRRGAFWEDRYFATAVDCGSYLARCLVYIDMNMVRAGVVKQPGEWKHCGYHEIQSPPRRYQIIDREKLALLLGLEDVGSLSSYHAHWINDAFSSGASHREGFWTETVAVGSQRYIEQVMKDLGYKARRRKVSVVGDAYSVKEPVQPYAVQISEE